MVPNKYIEVKESGIQGMGVYARRKIKKGQRIIEYTGEKITVEEEIRRYDDESMDRHHTFLFSIDENITIDGAVGGNESRFINHCCQPNCETVNEEDRIFVESIKMIRPGDELTYDYGFECDEPITEELIEQYPCHCGANKCRGTILLPGGHD